MPACSAASQPVNVEVFLPDNRHVKFKFFD